MKKKFLLSIQLLFALSVFTLFATAAPGNNGKKINYGKNELYYKGATEAEARRLGDYLREGGKYFDDSTRFAVQLEKKNNNYIIRLVVNMEKIRSTNDLNDENYNFITGELSKNVFNGKPITVEVTDGAFKAIKAYKSKQ